MFIYNANVEWKLKKLKKKIKIWFTQAKTENSY